MEDETRRYLRVMVAQAISMTPGPRRRALGSKVMAESEPAKAEIVDRIVANIEDSFELQRKPVVMSGPSLHSRLTRPD